MQIQLTITDSFSCPVQLAVFAEKLRALFSDAGTSAPAALPSTSPKTETVLLPVSADVPANNSEAAEPLAAATNEPTPSPVPSAASESDKPRSRGRPRRVADEIPTVAPSAAVAAPEAAPVKLAVPQPAPSGAVTLDDVREAASTLFSISDSADTILRAINARFGVAKLSEIPRENLADAHADILKACKPASAKDLF